MTTGTLFAPRGDRAEIEEGTRFQPAFDADGLIPCITQHAESGEVLMFAFMNREALSRTLELGEAVYWSRSRRALWHKGATSGHVQKVVELRTDCDQDVILLRVLSGPACHVGYDSCFYRAVMAGQGAREGAVEGEAVLHPVKEGKAYDPEAVYGRKG